MAELLPGRAFDRLHRVLEAAARGLYRRQLAQPVGVTLDRQIQDRVSRVQIPQPGARYASRSTLTVPDTVSNARA